LNKKQRKRSISKNYRIKRKIRYPPLEQETGY